ncbi:MAG: asparagine synthase C-terminal domain-containing protein, partial [bacterium]
SSYIAKIASDNKIVSSLSLDSTSVKVSERKSINYITRKLKIINHKSLLTKKIFLNNLDNILKAYDQPSIDGINTYFISKFANNNNVKVLLSGLGSDELLLGYTNDKYFPYMKYLYKIRVAIKYICKIFQSKNSKFINKLNFVELKKELFYYLFSRGIFNPYQVSQILNLPKISIIKTLNNLFVDTNNSNDYAFYSSIQNHFYLKSQLLCDTDKFSMNFGVEIRVPFLNPNLYKLLIYFFNTNKRSDYLNKKILKEHFSLPNQTKKQGFCLPMDDWIKELKTNNQLNPNAHWSKKWALYLVNNYKI